ncbi:hypothetical protein GCM10028808_11470 [Spirosoma migulaei]
MAVGSSKLTVLCWDCSVNKVTLIKRKRMYNRMRLDGVGKRLDHRVYKHQIPGNQKTRMD